MSRGIEALNGKATTNHADNAWAIAFQPAWFINQKGLVTLGAEAL